MLVSKQFLIIKCTTIREHTIKHTTHALIMSEYDYLHDHLDDDSSYVLASQKHLIFLVLLYFT